MLNQHVLKLTNMTICQICIRKYRDVCTVASKQENSEISWLTSSIGGSGFSPDTPFSTRYSRRAVTLCLQIFVQLLQHLYIIKRVDFKKYETVLAPKPPFICLIHKSNLSSQSHPSSLLSEKAHPYSLTQRIQQFESKYDNFKAGVQYSFNGFFCHYDLGESGLQK